MKRMLYDIFDYFLDDDEIEAYEEEFEQEYDPYLEMEIDFDAMFNNKYANKKFVVVGYHDLWDGTYYGNSPRAYDSIKEAIIESERGFGDCHTDVYEENYGKLMICTHHHDSYGGNVQEIRELTKYGEELYNKGYSVERLLKMKKTTRNVKFLGRYW